MMKISLITPAFKEEGNVQRLVSRVTDVFENNDSSRNFELIIVVNDDDPSNTPSLAADLSNKNPTITSVHRNENPGFGNAIKAGLDAATGDILIPLMCDFSDDPQDALRLAEAIEAGNDIAYGSRFAQASSVNDYPPIKLLLNRAFNHTTKIAFGVETNDITNIFSAYHSNIIENIGVNSLKSESFDITVELPIRAHMEAQTYTEVPVSFNGRDVGESNFQIGREGPLFAKRLAQLFWQYRLPLDGSVKSAEATKKRM
ncbi:glycosyltransferase family 2 protein [Haladaptatus pallidirubidus]|uniref:Glycosyltransferase 2-like domain-containing protein n=1 Tax=Haladaptatus pallidirubidus TaxID=1008152 RepID=A0AAV3UP20_9EURY|nr:glycosyltransferase family 2 protein [Haladaptatus pallidirubidus]